MGFKWRKRLIQGLCSHRMGECVRGGGVGVGGGEPDEVSRELSGFPTVPMVCKWW